MNKDNNYIKTHDKRRNVLIGGAWPYANSSLHLGHLAALISGDFLKRYHELLGDNVLYVSGTDCHGTPITERAKSEKIEPKDIAEKYHNIERLEFKKACNKIIELIEIGNQYYDERKPWIQKGENIEEFNNTIYTCANVIANLSNLLEPIMPETSKKVREYLKIKNPSWKQLQIKEKIPLENIEILFERIDMR